MIPAVLPSPRVDARPEVRAPGDDRGFDDALRRAADDGRDTCEGVAMHPADGADDPGERDAPTPARTERPRPDDEPEARPSADLHGDTTPVVACPAPAVPAPTDVAAGHVTATDAPPASAAAPGTTLAALDAATDSEAPAIELGVTTTTDVGPAADVSGPAGGPGGAAEPDITPDAPDAPDAPVGSTTAADLEAADGSARPTAGSADGADADGAHPAASVDGADRPTAPVPGRPASDVGDADRAPLPATSDPATPTADDIGAPTLPAPTVASGATSAPTTAAAPPVAQQLVQHVTPLVEGPDGTHELTIELRPAALGRVQLEVTLEDGVLHVRVHAEDPASRRLLGQSLGELRVALADAGISAGSLDVGDPGTGGGARTADRDAGDRPGPHVHDLPPAAARPDAGDPTRSLTDGRTALDVLL